MTAGVRRGPLAWRIFTNEHRFGLYFAGAALSNLGNWCQTLAGVLLIYRLTDSVLVVGLASAAQFVWPLLLGPWAGLVADRFDRRRVLYITQSAAAVVSGALAVLTFSGLVTVTTALVAIALLGVAQSFQAPAQIALVPLLVPVEHREVGLSLSSSQFNIARVLGPVLASGLVLVGGVGLPFLVNAVSFLGFVLLLWLLRPARQEIPQSPPRVRETIAVLARERTLLPLFAVGLVLSGTTDMITTLGPALAVELTGSDALTGWLVTAFGVGATIGALWLAPALRRFPRRLFWTLLAQAVGAFAVVLAPVPAVALAGAAVFGAGFLLSSNRTLNAVHGLITPDLIGRVSAVWLMAFLGGRVGYALGAGALADLAGPRVAGLAVAVTLLPALLVVHRLGSRARPTAPDPPAADPEIPTPVSTPTPTTRRSTVSHDEPHQVLQEKSPETSQVPLPTPRRHVWVVNSDLPADVADEFNAWYVNTHIPQILQIPGWVSGERLELSPAQYPKPETDLRRYLSVFEIEGDPEEAFAALRTAGAEGRLDKPPAASVTTTANFVPIAPRATRADTAAG